jgi:hypothetical protein
MEGGCQDHNLPLKSLQTSALQLLPLELLHGDLRARPQGAHDGRKALADFAAKLQIKILQPPVL